MSQDDYYRLGEVIKTHGIKGEVTVHLDVDFPEAYHELESVFLEQEGRLVPFFIDAIHIHSSKAHIQFEDIHSQEEAKALVKCALFLPVSLLPELPKGKFYYHDLIGCEVLEGETILGKVKEVYDLPGNGLIFLDANTIVF